MKIKKFVMTAEHLTLLKRFQVGWQDCEAGAPEIDPKRPYGNSDVENDIHEMMTGETIGCTDSKRDELTDKEITRYQILHRETETALQVALATGTFAVGEYECESYSSEWRRVSNRK